MMFFALWVVVLYGILTCDIVSGSSKSILKWEFAELFSRRVSHSLIIAAFLYLLRMFIIDFL